MIDVNGTQYNSLVEYLSNLDDEKPFDCKHLKVPKEDLIVKGYDDVGQVNRRLTLEEGRLLCLQNNLSGYHCKLINFFVNESDRLQCECGYLGNKFILSIDNFEEAIKK